MSAEADRIAGMQPRLIERECGGWLALSPDGALIRIGVTGTTDAETREAFGRAAAEWARLHDLPDPLVVLGAEGAEDTAS